MTGIAYAVGKPAGSEVNRGFVVDVLESLLTAATALAAKGEPAFWNAQGGVGNVGVVVQTAAAATDFIPVQTSGVFNLTVDSDDGVGDTAIAFGDPIYLNGSGVLNQNPAGVYFGRALATKTGSATPSVIPVSVGAAARPAAGQEIIEIITASGGTLQPFGSSDLDSTANDVNSTLGSGTFIGQIKNIVMTEASNSSTVSVTAHVTSNPEVFTFNAVNEFLQLVWTGLEWDTVVATATV